MVLLAVGGVAVAAVAGLLVVRRQLRPLREVADTAHRVSELPLAPRATSTSATGCPRT